MSPNMYCQRILAHNVHHSNCTTRSSECFQACYICSYLDKYQLYTNRRRRPPSNQIQARSIPGILNALKPRLVLYWDTRLFHHTQSFILSLHHSSLPPFPRLQHLVVTGVGTDQRIRTLRALMRFSEIRSDFPSGETDEGRSHTRDAVFRPCLVSMIGWKNMKDVHKASKETIEQIMNAKMAEGL